MNDIAEQSEDLIAKGELTKEKAQENKRNFDQLYQEIQPYINPDGTFNNQEKYQELYNQLQQKVEKQKSFVDEVHTIAETTENNSDLQKQAEQAVQHYNETIKAVVNSASICFLNARSLLSSSTAIDP